MRRRPAPDPKVVTDLIAMFGVSTVEQAQKRLAEEDARFDVAKELGLTNTRHAPVVYYMRMDRLIKIGYSTNLSVRVATIMPQGVLALEFGGRAREQQRHSEFRADHSHLEWFWLSEPLWNHIIRLRDDFSREQGKPVEQWLAEHHVAATVDVLDHREEFGFT